MINLISDKILIPSYDKEWVRVDQILICNDMFRRAKEKFEAGIDFIQVLDKHYKELFWLREEQDNINFGDRIIKLRVDYKYEREISDYSVEESLLIQEGKIDTYVFYRFEEYTCLLAKYLIKKYPGKRVIFLDKNAQNFFGENEIEYQNGGRKKYLKGIVNVLCIQCQIGVSMMIYAIRPR